MLRTLRKQLLTEGAKQVRLDIDIETYLTQVFNLQLVDLSIAQDRKEFRKRTVPHGLVFPDFVGEKQGRQEKRAPS